ncbi:hypothetical protein AJ80_00458 [Polytolypa hystricis UAMH7299]|uniref:Uncharacterized protein n=1 Tax=Polytolypa hystricis (strain UAMH7299) TaxID=1447883 RepID=A0A2B7Z454_POLH7|nr:hypothetical protein AJ80_00458 [Polytolypa hystricis UAMH7299]
MRSLPLAWLSEWAPFQLDALGLVTVFGAKEMNTSIGNLVHSWATDWLPVLGSYAVANNEIAQPEPGFVLYNITDGIMATDVSSWFTRWLMSFPLTYTATTIRLGMDGRPRPALHWAGAMAIGFSTTAVLLVFTIITDDAWGIANVAAMAFSVLLRQLMASQLRSSIDKTIENLQDDPGADVKIFLTLPNGKAVTILGSRQIVVNCILTDARPVSPRYYYLMRVASWAVFGAHAITLGMSTLFNQIFSVVALLLGTYLTAAHVGDSREAIGTRLRLEVDMGDPAWFRPPAYARLNMSPAEEEHMVHWSMMPQRSNTWWWERYRRNQLSILQQAECQPSNPAAREVRSTKGRV